MSLKPKQVDFKETWQHIQLIVNEVISVKPVTKNNWSDCFSYPCVFIQALGFIIWTVRITCMLFAMIVRGSSCLFADHLADKKGNSSLKSWNILLGILKNSNHLKLIMPWTIFVTSKCIPDFEIRSALTCSDSWFEFADRFIISVKYVWNFS